MIEKLLQLAVDKNASDLHLTVGRPPTLRIAGRLRTVNLPPLTPEETRKMVTEIAPEKNQQELEKVGSSDFGYAYKDYGRFRCAIFMQKGVVGMVLRLIPSKVMSFEQIGLPESLKEVIKRPRGLFLVTGPTGSGKTTTLATIIDYLNNTFDYHIVTIEDPIEFYHKHKKSIVSQREMGVDVPGFAEGLRRALRQDPDTILVGEMRDLETTRAALTAAETGHLVFGTLHTRSTSSTIIRIIDQFPVDQQEQIRIQLSVSLLAVISQVLLPTKDGRSRVAAFEIMYMTPAIANLIRENKSNRLDDEILKGRNMGMITLDEHLFSLYTRGLVKKEDMLEKSMNPQAILNKIAEAQAAHEAAQQRR
jgi:twitching motility protein PilT